MTDPAALARIVAFFEHIAPSDVARIGDIYTEDAYFRDPFNEVRGVASIARIYAQMFERLEECRFVVADTVSDDEGAFLVWDFTFSIQRWRPRRTLAVHGTSHIKLSTVGKIAYHRDYWDAAEELYAKLPLIGPLMRFLRKTLA